MDEDFLFKLGFILMMDEVEEREARKSLEESADLDSASREDEDEDEDDDEDDDIDA